MLHTFVWETLWILKEKRKLHLHSFGSTVQLINDIFK